MTKSVCTCKFKILNSTDPIIIGVESTCDKMKINDQRQYSSLEIGFSLFSLHYSITGSELLACDIICKFTFIKCFGYIIALNKEKVNILITHFILRITKPTNHSDAELLVEYKKTIAMGRELKNLP